MKPKQLYRTTYVVWSTFPTDAVEFEDVARDATSGESLCASSVCERIIDPDQMPNTEFFDMMGEDDEEAEED